METVSLLLLYQTMMGWFMVNLSWAWKTYSVKGQIIHSVGFEKHTFLLQLSLIVEVQMWPWRIWKEWCDCVPLICYLWRLRFDFHIIFVCHEIFFWMLYFIGKSKGHSSLWSMKIWMVGLTWPQELWFTDTWFKYFLTSLISLPPLV